MLLPAFIQELRALPKRLEYLVGQIVLFGGNLNTYKVLVTCL